MTELASRIAINLAGIRDRMAQAAARCGRMADEVTLVAVTKTAGVAEIRALIEAGCRQLGEGRPQQLWDKAAALTELPVRWHLIGHLQRNKVRRTLPLVEMIHSVDSVELAEAIDRIAGELGRRVSILLEVKIAEDAEKHGFEPRSLQPHLERLAGLRHASVSGLMGMASLDGGLDAARRDFALLRGLRERLVANCPDTIQLTELSMGMSGDFEVAIEEGATLVRVGSALFEGC